MPTIIKSLRIPEKILKEIKEIAKESGKDFSTVTKELLKEAIRMHRCPGIIFTEGVSGRRARVAGTGIEVWEIIASFEGMGKDFKRLKQAYHWLTEQQLKAAIGYWEAYPEEIDFLISENESWTMKQIQKRFPFLSSTK